MHSLLQCHLRHDTHVSDQPLRQKQASQVHALVQMHGIAARDSAQRHCLLDEHKPTTSVATVGMESAEHLSWRMAGCWSCQE